MLALRPSDAKNPVLVGCPRLEGAARDRTDGGDVLPWPLLELERIDCCRCRSASVWYGRLTGTLIGLAGSKEPQNADELFCCERSVATLASGRRGNVASETIDAPEVILGLGENDWAEGPRGGGWAVRYLISITQSDKPQS